MTEPETLKPPPRAVLVTGAARRIGRAVARDLAAAGHPVAVHYFRSREAADSLVAEIAEAGGTAAALGADLSREAEIAALVPRAAEALGPLGCLVNNAARFEVDSHMSGDRETWDLHMEVNLRAPFLLAQAFFGQLPARARGNIVNLVDQRVWNLTPYFASYTLSKSGLWTLTQTMALAMAPRVRVNAIGPGPTLPSPRQSDDQFARQVRTVPLGRGPTLDEICRAVRFILEADSMTGQMLTLDGGQHLGWAQRPADGGVVE